MVKSTYIIDVIIKGGSLHRSLAQNAANNVMYGSLGDWHSFLASHVKLDFYVPDEVKELFLVRHCIIHNNHRVSNNLHYSFGHKYNESEVISLEVSDIKAFKDNLFSLALKIAGEFDVKYPNVKGTWIE